MSIRLSKSLCVATMQHLVAVGKVDARLPPQSVAVQLDQAAPPPTERAA